jgi:hypothetical protein
MNKQPNFDKVKQAFYDLAISSDEIHTAAQIQLLTTRTTHRKAIEDFKVELNDWLNKLDIRNVNDLIDFIREKDKRLIPQWIANKQFVIDYNEHIHLDLCKK